MATQPEYDVQLKEIHHTQKLDKPSGTAVTLAGRHHCSILNSQNGMDYLKKSLIRSTITNHQRTH